MELSKEERKRLKAEKKAEKALMKINELPPGEVAVTVLCVRFGNKYGREYVERLRNMVSRHLTIPYDFACLTDDNHPIDGVRTIFMPDQGYSKKWWHKVHMFDSRLPLRGRILFFDLDVVIHNNINKLATTFTNDFIGIHDFNRKFHPGWQYLNSSVLAWNHNTQNHIWDQFKSNPGEAQKLQGDQDWIWKVSKDRIKWWPKDWTQSYKWEIRRKEELILQNGKRQFKTENHEVELPKECCVTVFHGDPKPQDVQDKFVVDNWR